MFFPNELYTFEWQIYRGDKDKRFVYKFFLCAHDDLDIPLR